MTNRANKRFFRKVCADEASGCHVWTVAKNVWGYGRLHRNGRMYSAHRVAWEIANGSIPDGLFVLHHCDEHRPRKQTRRQLRRRIIRGG
jgi:hypothetical protein